MRSRSDLLSVGLDIAMLFAKRKMGIEVEIEGFYLRMLERRGQLDNCCIFGMKNFKRWID